MGWGGRSISARTSFDELLTTAANGDLEGLRAKKTALEQENADLVSKLAEVTREIRELDAKIMVPIKNAIKAAQLLNIEILAEYGKVTVNGNGRGQNERSKGKFQWGATGHGPFQADVSGAMWRISSGSGGSAGKHGEGILTADEFWKLAGLTPDEVALGQTHRVTLPNKKEVGFQRIEG
jgi:hypothetical protein